MCADFITCVRVRAHASNLEGTLVVECGLSLRVHFKITPLQTVLQSNSKEQVTIWKLTTYLLNKECSTFHVYQQILQELCLASH
jgi:hypothetical protein